MNDKSIARYRNTRTVTQFEPQTMEQLVDFCERLARSEMVPELYRGKPDNIFVAVQWGYEIGLKPLQAVQNIAVVNGRPSLWGDAMLAIVMSSGQLEDMLETTEEHERGEIVAICTVKRRGNRPIQGRYSISQAEQAGLMTKDVWKKYPSRMLKFRARGYALRDAFPDLIRGFGVVGLDDPTEIDSDIEPADIDETPAAASNDAIDADFEDTPTIPADAVRVDYGQFVNKDGEPIGATDLPDGVIIGGKLRPALVDQVIKDINAADSIARLEEIGVEIRDKPIFSGYRDELREYYRRRAAKIDAINENNA